MNQPLKELPVLSLNDLQFIYRKNFAGAAVGFDDEGDRNFNAILPDPQQALAMEADGWPVKRTKPGKNHPNPEEHIEQFYIKVNIGYKFRPPTIWMIREVDGQQKGTVITEKNISLLDSADFIRVDAVVRAVHYDNNGNTGYKVWLSEFYGTVQTTEVGNRYAFLMEDSSGPSEDNDY